MPIKCFVLDQTIFKCHSKYNMNIKAIFFDIDGTLVPFGQKKIPKEVKDALLSLKDKGIKIFIATGRQISWINNLDGLEFDGYVTINGCAELLCDKKTIIYQHAFPKDNINRLIEYSKIYPFPFVIVPLTGKIFTTGENELFRRTCKLLNLPYTPLQNIEHASNEEIAQILGFLTTKEEISSGLFENVLTDGTGTRWTEDFIDIIPRGVNKAIGIDKMVEYFDIDISETMAFGDGDNDIDMLKHVGYGIAMGNASKGAKKTAKYITTKDVDNGIINALTHYNIL